jgi:hypothetical protein
LTAAFIVRWEPSGGKELKTLGDKMSRFPVFSLAELDKLTKEH